MDAVEKPSGADQVVGVLTIDTDMRIRSWDEWLERATGISAESAVGHLLTEIVPDLEERGLLPRVEQVLTDGSPSILSPAFHRYLIRCAPSVPSKYFQEMRQKVIVAPLREGARIVGAVITVEDVTARMDYERELAERMQGADEATRLEIARSLASTDEPGGEGLLMEALGDEHWHVRQVAADGLARRGGPDVVADLLRTLRQRHRDIGVLNSVLEVLRGTDVDVLEPLVEMLGEADPDMRIYIAQTLGDLGDSRAIPALVNLLGDSNTNVRYHAVEALGKLRAGEAVEALLQIAESRDFFLSFAALEALAQVGDASVAPRLVPLLEEPSLAEAAITALAALGDESVVEPLVTLLNREGSPATAIASALTAVHGRYASRFAEEQHIETLVASTIRSSGIRQLVQALEEAKDSELRAVVRVLGWLRSQEAGEALVGLLQNPNVRGEVVEALVRCGPKVTHLLTARLLNGDTEARQAAAAALGRIGDPSAVPALVEALEDQPSLAVTAAGALAKIGDRSAFEALIGILGHPNISVRQAAIAALNSLGHPDMLRRLLSLLEDANPRVRESAVKIAGYFGYPECLDLLFARCRDSDPAVRRAALESLPYQEDPRVLPTLAEAMHDEDARTRAVAARALAQVEGTPVLRLLLEALNDPDPWVRYFAARSIGEHRYPEGMGPLAQLAEGDPAQHVRIAAVESVAAIGGTRAAALVSRIAESGDPDLASAAIAALGRIHHPDSVPPLLAAIRSPDPRRRSAAVQAFRDLGSPQAASALQWVAAADTEPSIAQEAINALAELATPEAVAGLLSLSANPRIREACTAAMARLSGERIRWLARGLSHPHAGVRSAAVEVLARIKDEQATEQLLTALDDKDPKVRLAATNALVQLGARRALQRLERLAREDPDPAVRNAAKRALDSYPWSLDNKKS